ARASVGILQPYLYPKGDEISPLQFFLMTMTALAFGLRDGKQDTYSHSTLIDVEESMPTRPDPNKADSTKSITQTHLPSLDEMAQKAQNPLSPEDLKAAQ